ncbi:MAG: multifunctional CCA tRNA nucleotidyl transferase/2'3'-cyclic phosphodiesterase/2'nucleotidase/phosphatase, partial [Myxococcota bacterium]|nr:multifunctional CCA tRNA nucleotidyl transferase/2'3'-cyclic phosphodiesterase/2'nucleotidase/phosphatase [Myxococcota bacterium]
MKPLQAYLVGGSVRDGLLGLPGQDRDWVVVGSTEGDLLARGFTAVGRDFPVFLHPETHEEYALARRWAGLSGGAWEHSPEISLEEDLACRDLTVNALAERPDGSLVDPFGGRRDLEARVLRHVGDAFVADPLRVLRVARFAAQLSPLGFTVAPETLELMAELTGSGCLASLVADRVWKELHRSLALPVPHPFFGVLADCGALDVVFPELVPSALGAEDRPLSALRAATVLGPSPLLRFASLAQALPSSDGDLVAGFCRRVRAPRQY